MIEQIKTKIQEIIENHRNLQKNVKSFNPDLAMGLQALIDEDNYILSAINSMPKDSASDVWHDGKDRPPLASKEIIVRRCGKNYYGKYIGGARRFVCAEIRLTDDTAETYAIINYMSDDDKWAYLDDLLKLEEISPKLPLISSKEELKQKPFKVEKGKWYLCIKDYHDKNCTFAKGKNYKSDKDGFLIDDEDKDTFERKIWEEDACEYFRPIKCMYAKDHYTDEDRKVLCVGCKEDCKYSQESASNVLDEELERFKKLHGPMATLERCAKHFSYWQKQMMMNDAVEGYAYYDYTDDKDREMMEVRADEINAKKYNIEDGDKVKLIIIKK